MNAAGANLRLEKSCCFRLEAPAPHLKSRLLWGAVQPHQMPQPGKIGALKRVLARRGENGGCRRAPRLIPTPAESVANQNGRKTQKTPETQGAPAARAGGSWSRRDLSHAPDGGKDPRRLRALW